jgi:hypothetical protein
VDFKIASEGEEGRARSSDSARGIRRRGGLTGARCDVGNSTRVNKAPVFSGRCD